MKTSKNEFQTTEKNNNFFPGKVLSESLDTKAYSDLLPVAGSMPISYDALSRKMYVIAYNRHCCLTSITFNYKNTALHYLYLF